MGGSSSGMFPNVKSGCIHLDKSASDKGWIPDVFGFPDVCWLLAACPNGDSGCPNTALPKGDVLVVCGPVDTWPSGDIEVLGCDPKVGFPWPNTGTVLVNKDPELCAEDPKTDPAACDVFPLCDCDEFLNTEPLF
jgi:hypothetical protein